MYDENPEFGDYYYRRASDWQEFQKRKMAEFEPDRLRREAERHELEQRKQEKREQEERQRIERAQAQQSAVRTHIINVMYEIIPHVLVEERKLRREEMDKETDIIMGVAGSESGLLEKRLTQEIKKLEEEIGWLRAEMNVAQSIARGQITSILKGKNRNAA